MKDSTKILTGVLVLVVVLGGFALVGRSELFKGQLTTPYTKFGAADLYLHKDEIVSAVASPVTSRVPSVVVSNVTSRGGTSRVASVVVSGVASSVASAVVVTDDVARGVDTRGLQTLTARILESVAKADQTANRASYEKAGRDYVMKHKSEFVLSEKEKAALIELYKKANPSEFTSR